MKLRLILGIAVVVLIVFLGVLFVNIVSNNFQIPFFTTRPTSTATINGHAFYITVATAEKDKEIGLSERNSLPKDQGMYFPFDHADYYAFWMRNMKFPIDIIYINNNKIVTIFSNVPKPANTTVTLPIYKPNQPANAVLEINAGLVNTYHFKVGDSVQTSL